MTSGFKYYLWVGVLLLSWRGALTAQKYDYNWVIGTRASENGDDRFGQVLLSFEDSFSVAARAYEASNIEIYVASTTMSTYEGELSFFTNGCEVHGAHGSLITDGDTMVESSHINGSFCYPSPDDGPPIGSPLIFSVLSLPDPIDENRYFILFSDREFSSDLSIYGPKLHGWHIEIDPLDPSLSRVIDKKVMLDGIQHAIAGYSATKSTKSDHWWVMIARAGETSNTYSLMEFYSLDSFRVQNRQIGQFGLVTCRGLFSPDGARYAALSCDDRLSVFAFDRSTGQLSDEKRYNGQIQPNGVSSCAFAPSGELLYVWDSRHMYQLDLVAPDGGDTLILIDTFDGFQDPFPAGFGVPQLGPDCRLYITSSSGGFSMHVIDYPDRRGRACGFRQHAIRLPRINNRGIPHYPNYRLDTEATCDSTLFVSVVGLPPPGKTEVSTTLYPVPAVDEVQVELASTELLPEWLEIYDAQGRLVDRQQWPRWQVSHTVDVRSLVDGLYLVRLMDTDADGFGQHTLKMVVGQ